jgi:hypothetical protein
MSKIRIAIIESPNPIDLFDNRSEAKALEASCSLMRHHAISFFVKSRIDFQSTINYLASADSIHASRNPSLPFFLHISSHGNSGCVALGKDVISWDDLTKDLTPLLENPDYSGKLVLSLSTCGSGENSLSVHAKKLHKTSPEIKMPSYIFSILGDTVNWDDALIAWNILYHKISKFGIENKGLIVDALEKIEKCVGVKFAYRRWSEDEGKYLRWPTDKQLD